MSYKCLLPEREKNIIKKNRILFSEKSLTSAFYLTVFFISFVYSDTYFHCFVSEKAGKKRK
jgi:hypothetical protein